jgi:hypothetical protein
MRRDNYRHIDFETDAFSPLHAEKLEYILSRL